MKKKLLLTLIPALMLLGSCAGAQPEVKAVDEFYEDTLLHEEIFGDVSSVFGKARRNALPDDVDTSVPAIGVQKADNGSTYSVRFIAATSLSEGAIASGKAVWTRTMYTDAGAQYKAAAARNSLVAYTTLRDGSGVEYSITDFNTQYETSYTSFVVYTMLNIPKTTYDNYYLNAYLTLTDTSKTSNVLATNVVGTRRVSFASSYTGYFLRGTINGVSGYVSQDNNKPDGSKARFIANFSANDTFYLVYNNTTANEFRIYDSSCLADNTFFENSNGKIKAKAADNYALLFDNSNKLNARYQGFYVIYVNNSDTTVKAPLVYAGESYGKLQYHADISPKTGATLGFENNFMPLEVAKESGDIDDDLVVFAGGDNIAIYFKDDQAGNYSLWCGYPAASTFVLRLNGVDQAAVNNIPSGWADKAVFESYINSGVTVSIKGGYDKVVTASSTTSEAAYYRIYWHDNNTVTYDKISSSYFLIGNFGGKSWSQTINDAPFVNGTTSGEYKLAQTITLNQGDTVKVTDGSTYYPGGMGDEYVIPAKLAGTCQIYFKTTYQNDWSQFGGYFYIENV